MEIDALPCSLGSDQNLNLAFAKLLLCMETCTRLVTRARLHAAVDAADAKTPGLEEPNEVVQRILELCEKEQALVRVVEKAFFLEQGLEFRELRLCARILDRLGLDCQESQFLDFLAHEVCASGERDRLEQRFQPVTLALFHFLQFFWIGEIWRRLAGEILCMLETFFQAPCAILE